MKCVIISGISSSGKTYLGKLLAKNLDYCFVDGDDFFLKDKPKYTLSNNTICTNWDCEEAVDWDLLNFTVQEILKEKNIILVTFLPLIERYTFSVWKHVRLLSGHDDETIIQRVIAGRKISKRLDIEEKIRKDALIVRELVYPRYLQTIRGKECQFLNVYDHNGNRYPEKDILDSLVYLIFE